MRRVFRFLLTFLSIAVLIAVVLGHLGGYIFVLDMLAHFRLHLLLLCIPLSLVAALERNFRAAWNCFAAGILALAGLGVLWEDPVRDIDGIDVTVMTANLYHGNDQPEEMKRVLLAADPDVLVTMETTKSVMTGENSLALRYPFRLSLSTTGQTLRTVIWSKFPMRDGRLLLEDRIEPTGAHAIIEVQPDVEFTVLGLHFAHNLHGNQKQQIEALNVIAETLPTPRVIVGDFNATAWSHALKRVEELTSTRRTGGFRITWRGVYPTVFGYVPAPMGLQIDHTLVTESIGVRSVDTLKIPGSDHLAERVQIVLPVL